MTSSGTISMHFVRSALETTERGDNKLRTRILSRIGVSSHQLRSSSARVTVQQYGELWRQLAISFDDEFLGQDSRRMKSGSFATMCHAAIACKTLAKVLDCSVRFFNLFLDDIAGSIAISDGYVSVIVSGQDMAANSKRFAHELYLMLLQGILSWSIGRRIDISSVQLSYEAPSYSPEYNLMYCHDVQFAADKTVLRFSEAYLLLPVVQNVQTLKTFLRTAPEPILVKYKPDCRLTGQIRDHLTRDAAHNIPSFNQVARELKMTPATLSRRLRNEGTCFRKIKETFRRQLALTALKNRHMDVLDIALKCGFSEASAFHRAFKKWTGVPPSMYRNATGPDIRPS